MGPGSFRLKRPPFRPPSRLGAYPSFWFRRDVEYRRRGIKRKDEQEVHYKH